MNILVGILIGAIIPAAGWLIQHRLQAARAAEQRLYDARKALYQDILAPYTRMMQAAGRSPPDATEHSTVIDFLGSVEHRLRVNELMMVGSDEVIGAFNRFVRFPIEVRAGKLTERSGDVLWLWADLVLAVRKDLGEPKTRLTPEAMIVGWVSDIDTVFPSYRSELSEYMQRREVSDAPTRLATR